MLICQCLQSLSFTLLLQHFYSFFSSFLLKALLATQLSTVSCYQLWLFRGICPPGFCLAEPQVHRGQPCCLSCLHHCLFALHTFLAQLSNKPFLFSQFTLASIASCITSSLLILDCPPRLPPRSRGGRGVAELLPNFLTLPASAVTSRRQGVL